MIDYKEKIKNLTSDQLALLLQKNKKIKTAVPVVDRSNPFFPLSFAQKRIWLHSELEKNNLIYHVPLALKVMLEEPLDVSYIENVVNRLIQKHEILRTIFPVRNGEMVQCIQNSLSIQVVYCDLRDDPVSLRLQKAVALATQEAKKPFDLERGPLIRFALFQIDDSSYIFLLVTHHLISDGWSNNLFFAELAQGLFSYQEEMQDKQYVDFVFWEQQRYQKAYVEQFLPFWQQYLNGDLPLTSVGERSASSIAGQKVFSIEKELSWKIRDFSKTNQVTLFVTLLSAFQFLLSRYTGEKDLLIGIPYANRTAPGFQKTLGIFMNLIPFRSQVKEEESFLFYVKRMEELTKTVFSHSDVPLNLLIEHLKRADSLFEILFVHQNFLNAYEATGIEIEPLHLDLGQVGYNLTFIVEEFRDELFIKIKYRNDIFVEQLFTHYKNILAQIIEAPQRQLSHCSLLLPEERKWLLEKAKHSDQSLFQEVLFCTAFERVVSQTPTAIALEYMGKIYTYECLNQRTNQLAHYLRRKTACLQEARIGIILDRTDQFLISVLSIWKAGAAFVPIDIQLPKERVLHLLEGVDLVVTYSPLFLSLAVDLPSVLFDREEVLIQKECTENLNLTISAHMLAYVIFTSGSTGQPKGVCVEHGQLAAYLQSIDHETADFELSRFAFTSTIAADMGYTNLFLPLVKGKTVVMVPKNTSDDPDLLSSFLEKSPVDCLKFVPSQLAFLLRGKNPKNILPKKLLILAGEATPDSLIKKVSALDSSCAIIISYGPTETTIGAMTNSSVKEKPWQERPYLGRPNYNNSIYLLDKRKALVPIGVAGEIYIGGKSVARGYYNQPQLTAECFIPDPFSMTEGTKMYKTGDKARYLKNGEMEFLGREDRQIKIRGFRIELDEIETALHQIADIVQAVVLVVEGRLTAFIISKLSEKEVRDLLKQQIPAYMIPVHIVFVDQFPLTPSGKTDEKMLLHAVHVQEKKVQIPRDSIELILVRIWEDILKIDKIGIEESFFDLGGHSFLALELMLKIEELFGLRMPLASLFENNTIGLLAKKIREGNLTFYQNPLVEIRRGSDALSLFFVHPAGGQVLCYHELAKSMQRDHSFYGLQALFIETDAGESSLSQTALKYREFLPRSEGQIVIGGWSLGALIAFEMARGIFEEQGKYPFVVMIDQPIPAISRIGFPSDDAGYLLRFLKQVEGFNEVSFGLGRLDFEGRSFQEQMYLVYQALMTKKLLPEEIEEGNFFQFLQFQKSQSLAAIKYEPQRYEGPTLLIRAESSQWETESASLGWETRIPNLIVKSVPGTHMSMMKQPHVLIVREAIEQWIFYAGV